MIGVKVLVFDMNNFEIEKELEIDLEETLKEEITYFLSKGKDHFLTTKGLSIDGLKLCLNDMSKLVPYIFNIVFPDYNIKDCQGYRYGHPDFILNKGAEEIYLELKVNDDSLRYLQINWFIKNKKVSTNKIIYIISEIPDYDPKPPRGYL